LTAARALDMRQSLTLSRPLAFLDLETTGQFGGSDYGEFHEDPWQVD